MPMVPRLGAKHVRRIVEACVKICGMSLPFVVVHGAVIWKLSLVALTGAVLALVALVRRYNMRRAAAAKLADLERRSDPRLVRGTLGGGEVATVIAALRGGGATTVELRPDALWIETVEGHVTLDGAVHVVVGSHAAVARGRVPAGTPEGVARKVALDVPLDVAVLARLSPGDAVIALGRLETVAGRDETDNRTNAEARVLRPIDDAPITLIAQRPRGAPLPMSVFGIAAIVILTPLIAWKIEGGLGASWREGCWRVPDPNGEVPFALSNTDACALATAMPGSREDALDRIMMLAERDSYRDRAGLDRLIELSRSIGSCDSTVRELRQAERYEEILRVARECGDRRAEYIALVDLGRFDEAVAIPVPTVEHGEHGSLAALPTGQMLILAGRWTDAAVAADAHGAAIRSKEHKPDDQAMVDMEALSYRCLGELLRHHGGDTGALARLRGLVAGQYGAVCAVALAQAVPEAEVAGVLVMRDVPLASSQLLLLKMRAFAIGTDDLFWGTDAESVLAQPDSFDAATEGSSIWLAAMAPPLAPDTPARARVQRERWQAVAATLGGDIVAARQHAVRALAAVPDDPAGENRELRFVNALPAVIELYTSEPITYTLPTLSTPKANTANTERWRWLHDFNRLLLRRGEPLIQDTYFGLNEDRDNYVKALETAARGDGRELAKRMGAQGRTWWADTDIMAVLPRVTVGREAIARQLAWGAPKGYARLDTYFPWSVALHAAARRAALHLAGEDAEAARWTEIYQRYDRALRDRKKLVALALWDI